jgi:hypothetical protein
VCAEGRMLESRGVVRHPAGVYNASAFIISMTMREVSTLMWFQAGKPYHIRAELQKIQFLVYFCSNFPGFKYKSVF